MTFACAKFKAFLPAATFAMAAEFLMGLSDSVICGHVIGETGLAAVNLMQSVFELVSFVSLLVAIGTSVLFSTEVGAFHLRRAKGYFTLGVTASILSGLSLAIVLAIVRQPVLTSFGASPEVFEAAMSYWWGFLPAAFLQPLAFFLGTMCYADGDSRLSMVSYASQLLGNCCLSVPLTMSYGPKGCALGTGLGALAAILVLLFHFRRRGCLWGWSSHWRLGDLLTICRTSLGDASKNVGKAVVLFLLNAYVIAHFGSDFLPVLAVVVMTISISEFFDGVGNAVQPLASVYIGERNDLLTKRVMRSAVRMSFFEGAGVMLLLLVFPELMLKLAGVDDPPLVGEACRAVRLVSVALLGLAVVLLFNSYYVFIGREMLSTGMTLLSVLVVPVALLYPLGAIWGLTGVWVALGLAPLVAVALCAAYVMFHEGVRRFPYLLTESREANLHVFDLELDPVQICATSTAVGAYLEGRRVDAVRAGKAALLVEEALMVVRDRNAGQRVLAEVTVDLNDGGVALVLRDDGVLFDITDADAKIASLRSYLVSNLMTVLPNRRNLTTTGFNRNVFRL